MSIPLDNEVNKPFETEFFKDEMIKSRYSLDNSEFNWSLKKNKKRKYKTNRKSDIIYSERINYTKENE